MDGHGSPVARLRAQTGLADSNSRQGNTVKAKNVIPIHAVLTLLLSLVLSPVALAEDPGLLYGTAGIGGTGQHLGTELVAFNLQAGSIRTVGNVGYPDSRALAFCRPGGRPHTITNMGNGGLAQLATLNLGTGAATLVGSPLGEDLKIMGVVCSPDGTLYAVGQTSSAHPNFNSLYTVDRKTGLATRVGSTNVFVATGAAFNGFIMALDFAPDGTLYGVNTKSLYTIDPSTGLAAKVADFQGVTMVMGLAIGKDWSFYVSDYVAQSKIYAVNQVTGAATPVLDTGLGFIHNIAFKAPGNK